MSRARPRTALVTGASSGIGAALAERLARDGAEVVLAARREAELEAVAARIRATGGRARVLVLDVSDTDATARAIRETDEAIGGLGLIVANAAIAGLRFSGELEWEACAAMIDVNVRGAVATLTAALPRLVERRRGHLVGISSMAAARGLPHNALYGASKAFLGTFLESLRVDLGPLGIAVTEVRPGFVRTAMTAPLDHAKPFELEPEVAARVIADGIARGDARVAFPWPTAALVRALSVLPAPLYDRAMRVARPAPSRPSKRRP